MKSIKNLAKMHVMLLLPLQTHTWYYHGSFRVFSIQLCKEIKNKINEVMAYIKTLKGVEMVIDKDESIKKLKQPKDRIGDIVVTSNEKFAIGKKESDHDLTKLKEPLRRTHGGLGETDMPIFISKKN